jgi:uncharacterized protein YndB with AHSA1/START domain
MSWTIETERSADVQPEAVFDRYLDPTTWHLWGHNAVWARSDGPLANGGIVEVRANYGKVYPCRITRLVPGRALVLVARPPLMTVTQTYEVEPIMSGSRVRHAIEVAAPFAGLMRLLGAKRMYQRLLDKEVDRLIELAAHGS